MNLPFAIALVSVTFASTDVEVNVTQVWRYLHTLIFHPHDIHLFFAYSSAMGDKQNSIGAGWTDMGKQSDIPSLAERAAMVANARKGLPEVRHKVQMRYERVLGAWRVTLSDSGRVIRECRFERDDTLEETIRRGRGFTCLADRQAVEVGMRQGLGIVTLSLDAEQFAALNQPR